MHISTLRRFIRDSHITIVTSRPSLVTQKSNLNSISRSQYSINNLCTDLTLVSSSTKNHISDASAALNLSRHIVIDKPISTNPLDTSRFISSTNCHTTPVNVFLQKRLSSSCLYAYDFLASNKDPIDSVSLEIVKYKADNCVNQLLNLGIHYLDIILFLIRPSSLSISAFSSINSFNKFDAEGYIDSIPFSMRFNTIDSVPSKIKLKIKTTNYSIILTESFLIISSLHSNVCIHKIASNLSSYSNFWSYFLSQGTTTHLATLTDCLNSENFAHSIVSSIQQSSLVSYSFL